MMLLYMKETMDIPQCPYLVNFEKMIVRVMAVTCLEDV